VCVVYTENKEYMEEKKNTQRFIVVHPMGLVHSSQSYESFHYDA